MRGSAGIPLTLLYVPADRPDRVRKAWDSPADVVILDLEDAVAASAKEPARARATTFLADAEPRPAQVRINAASTVWFAEDIDAVNRMPIAVEVRVPKVESGDHVRELAARLPARSLHLLIESALGVERAFEIAGASEQVASISLGEADLRGDLRVADDAGLAYARSRIVVAARAAGLPSPTMSAFPQVHDLEALERSCQAGRASGFLGRTAIHPRQLETIRTAFLPTTAEVERAHAIVSSIESAASAGDGTVVLPDGTFLDAAMVEHARAVVALSSQHSR
ncbi:HpcH/HpaI aldolase/citrate lyase family protein [Agromyces bauzanensis]